MESIFYQSETLKLMIENDDQIIEKCPPPKKTQTEIKKQNNIEEEDKKENQIKIKKQNIFEEEEKKSPSQNNEIRNSMSKNPDKICEDPVLNENLLNCLTTRNKKRFLIMGDEKTLNRKTLLKEKELKVISSLIKNKKK